jgi:hypothetical protein
VTTIAIRGCLVAADTGVTSSAGCRVGFMTKIARSPDGYVGGATGSSAFAYAFLEWVRGRRLGDAPACEDGDRGVVAELDGTITSYDRFGSCVMRGPYFAIGSGSSEALGALFMGASAARAVEAAIAHDDGTFGEIEQLKVGEI